MKEPYFNEPGFEKYQGTEEGEGYSKRYNLQIGYATLIYAIREQIKKGPSYFKVCSFLHFCEQFKIFSILINIADIGEKSFVHKI